MWRMSRMSDARCQDGAHRLQQQSPIQRDRIGSAMSDSHPYWPRMRYPHVGRTPTCRIHVTIEQISHPFVLDGDVGVLFVQPLDKKHDRNTLRDRAHVEIAIMRQWPRRRNVFVVHHGVPLGSDRPSSVEHEHVPTT